MHQETKLGRIEGSQVLQIFSFSSVCFSFVDLVPSVDLLHIRTLRPEESISFASLLRDWNREETKSFFRQAIWLPFYVL